MFLLWKIITPLRKVTILSYHSDTQRLTSKIIELGDYTVVERANLDKVLAEMKFQTTSGLCSDSKCAVEIGKMIGAKYMVVGSVSKVGSTYSIDSRLISVETGESYISATYSNDNKQLQLDITDSFSAFDSLVISGMRIKKDGNYSGDFASSPHFKMSLPDSSDSFYPIHLDNSRSDLSISYSSAHLKFESSQGANRIVFFKGGANSEIINVTILGGSLSNSINTDTDIKLMLPTSLNLAWAEIQSAQIDGGTPSSLINKINIIIVFIFELSNIFPNLLSNCILKYIE